MLHDIENNSSTESLNSASVKLDIQANQFKRNVSNMTIRMESKRNKMNTALFALFVFVSLLFSPIMICDLYYGYNDSTCATNPAQPLNINLRDFLIVSGYLALGEIVLMIYMCWMIINNPDSVFTGFVQITGTILIYFCCLFAIVWSIIGGIIFWGYMDNTTCSSSVFNYVFASLIIRYVCYFITMTQSNNKDD
jgi:hypothetical protein